MRVGQAQSLASGGFAESLVDLLEIELADRRPEVLVVEDLLVDLVVGIDAGDDGLHEPAIEDKPEVLDRLLARLLTVANKHGCSRAGSRSGSG